MRSSTPIVFGFLALVGAAFWYDAHSEEIAARTLRGDVPAATATANASPAPADDPSSIALAPSKDEK